MIGKGASGGLQCKRWTIQLVFVYNCSGYYLEKGSKGQIRKQEIRAVALIYGIKGKSVQGGGLLGRDYNPDVFKYTVKILC